MRTPGDRRTSHLGCTVRFDGCCTVRLYGEIQSVPAAFGLSRGSLSDRHECSGSNVTSSVTKPRRTCGSISKKENGRTGAILGNSFLTSARWVRDSSPSVIMSILSSNPFYWQTASQHIDSKATSYLPAALYWL